LESVCWGNSTVGSNPTLSAIPIFGAQNGKEIYRKSSFCWICDRKPIFVITGCSIAGSVTGELAFAIAVARPGKSELIMVGVRASGKPGVVNVGNKSELLENPNRVKV
jgi:hypothetical protein